MNTSIWNSGLGSQSELAGSYQDLQVTDAGPSLPTPAPAFNPGDPHPEVTLQVTPGILRQIRTTPPASGGGEGEMWKRGSPTRLLYGYLHVRISSPHALHELRSEFYFRDVQVSQCSRSMHG